MCENPERAQRHGRGGGPPLKFLRRPGQPPGLRPDPFPDRAASLLPGLLAATRTGLTPAGDDELMFGSGHSINHLQTLGTLPARGVRAGTLLRTMCLLASVVAAVTQLA